MDKDKIKKMYHCECKKCGLTCYNYNVKAHECHRNNCDGTLKLVDVEYVVEKS